MKNTFFTFFLKNIGLVLLFGLLTITACVKEEDLTMTTTITSEPQQLITTTLYGRVMDAENNAIENASVTYKSGTVLQTIQTDEKGYFFLQGIQNKGKSAYVTVQYTGMFDAFRRMSVQAGRYNYTEIKMNEKSIIGQLSAQSGGTLDHASGAKITLPAQGIIDEDGNNYEGNIDVAMAWIDPSAADLPQRMVGDLSGIDAEGNVRSLGSFGMLQVELLDASGNELNIAPDSEAELVFPVPAELQGNAPEIIPLWSYDEEQGTWIQEGEATYANGVYTGKVSHFSSWNVDCLSDPIEVSGNVYWRLQDNEDIEASYLSVFVCGEKFGRKGGWLCDDGSFLFYNFPKDEVFELKIIDLCGQTIYQETYGPFSENTDLGTITVEVENEMIALTGNAIDCNGTPVQDGFVSTTFGDFQYNYPLENNGTFKFSIDFCAGAEGELYVVDTDAQLISAANIFDGSQETWAFPDIVVCDELEEYIEITIDGETPALFTPGVYFVDSDSIQSITYSFKDVTTSQYNYISLSFEPVAGSATIPALNFIYSQDNWNTQNGFYYYISEGDAITITFTEYNTFSGAVIKGTFEGKATNEFTGEQKDVSGSFHVTVN